MTELEVELIGGRNPVVEALRSGRELNKIWVAEGVNKKSIGEIMKLAKEAGVVVQTCAEAETRWYEDHESPRDYRFCCCL